MNGRKKQLSRKSGFTLLELLVATTISVGILVLITQVVGVVLQQTERSVGLISRRQTVDDFRHYLVADIQSAFIDDTALGTIRLQSPGYGWGVEGWESVPHECKPSDEVISTNAAISDKMDGERWGREGVQAMWLVNDPLKGMNDPGGLKVVGYQMKRIQVGEQGYPRYVLMRSEVSAGQTLAHGYCLQYSAYDHGSFSDSAFWSASTLRYPNQNHVIAGNIIDFGIRLFERDSVAGEWKLVFPNASGVLFGGHHPLIWVVMVRVLSDEGAELIESIEQGRVALDWTETAVEYSEVFSFKVETY